jgi:cyclic beta-1,2-glucan synthetase
MYRLALESICGLQWRSASLRLRPRLPTHWPSVTLTLRRPDASGRRGQPLRLTLCAASAVDDIARALELGARRLAEGEWLSLDEADAVGHCVVVCASARTPPRSTSTARAEPAA